MKRPPAAFTLIELLVTIAIVALLSAIAFPVFNSARLTGRRTVSMANMRQLGIALISYTGDHAGQLPTEGEQSPSWGSAAANSDANNAVWYNALPRYANSRAVGDFAGQPAAFYQQGSLFYVPAAVYPANKLAAPLFAVSFCSKLYGTVGGVSMDGANVSLLNFQAPASTVILQESGVPGEKLTFPTQSAYNGQSKSFASRTIARYNGHTLSVMADGHVENLEARLVVDPSSGKAFYPQSAGKVFWTMDPLLNPN